LKGKSERWDLKKNAVSTMAGTTSAGKGSRLYAQNSLGKTHSGYFKALGDREAWMRLSGIQNRVKHLFVEQKKGGTRSHQTRSKSW